jgi:hypothetical protein
MFILESANESDFAKCSFGTEYNADLTTRSRTSAKTKLAHGDWVVFGFFNSVKPLYKKLPNHPFPPSALLG